MTIRIPALRQTAHGTYPIVTRLLGAAFLALALATLPVLTAEATMAGDAERAWQRAAPGDLSAQLTPVVADAGSTASSGRAGGPASYAPSRTLGSQTNRTITSTVCGGGYCCSVRVSPYGWLEYYCWKQ